MKNQKLKNLLAKMNESGCSNEDLELLKNPSNVTGGGAIRGVGSASRPVDKFDDGCTSFSCPTMFG